MEHPTKNNLYDINTYTDEQLYNILNVSEPTDNELEARILQMIRRYSNIQNEAGDQLARFFNQVYDHFFDTSEDDANEHHPPSQIEGFDTLSYNMNTKTPIDTTNIRKPTTAEIKDPKGIVSKEGKINYKKYTKETEGTTTDIDLTKISTSRTIQPNASQTDNIMQTQNLDYSKDNTGLNPLLKQTIKRTINIDSNFRNKVYYPLSTDFTFNLSEPLKDVLSLKLYSVQIPYTWYTISNNYGSNFIYLKGTAPGIDKGINDYKIEIQRGNYNNADFATNINASIANIKAAHTDVSFGQTGFSFNPISTRSTFTIDIQNIYNESYYQIVMDPLLASYLKFNQTQYPLNTIYSQYTQSPTDLNYKSTFTLDTSTNYFTVIHYTDLSNQYGPNSIILNKIPVVMNTTQIINNQTVYTPFVGTVRREDIANYVNNGIQIQPLLDPSHSIMSSTIDTINNTYLYTLSLQLNKYNLQLNPNSKLCVQFPSKDQYTNTIDLNNTFWCNEYISTTHILNEWQYIDLTNFNYGNYTYNQFQWSSVSMSEFGQYQSAAVSIKNILQQKSNLYYSVDYGDSWNVATDISGQPLPINYVWNRVIVAGNGTYQFAFSTNNSKLWFSVTQGRTWIDSGLDYPWSCLDAVWSDIPTIIAANQTNNKIYYLTLDITTNTISMNEIFQLTNDDKYNGIPLGLKTVFEQNSTNYNWTSISISQNGMYQVAITFNAIYYSNDYGNTWNVKSLIYNNQTITNLSNVRTTYNENAIIPKYVTITNINTCFILDPSASGWLDSSRNWVQSPQSFNYIQSLSITDDSSTQVICDNTFDGTHGNIYTSNDYGYTWKNTTPGLIPKPIENIGWKEVSISKNNALYQIAVGINDISGGIYKLYYNSNILSKVTIYDKIQSFVGFDQKIIDISNSYPSQDVNHPSQILQYFFYNMNVLYSENYYNYSYPNFQVTTYNNIIKFVSESGHDAIDQYAAQPIIVTLTPNTYTLPDLLTEINAKFSNIREINGTTISKISSNSNGYEYLRFQFSVSKIYTSSDYKLVFYDVYSFVTCFFGASGVKNITWDNTLGWILGYRDFTEYNLTFDNLQTKTDGTTYYKGSPNSKYTYTNAYDTITGSKTRTVVSLTGDTSVNTTLYNYFYIVLDDFNQNHLNDGVVINIQGETNLPLPSYSSRAIESCDNGNTIYSGSTLTQNQIISMNTVNQSAIPDITSQTSIKQHASYPSIQDVFAFIPMKTNGLTNGSTYIEFGGTLQNQSRLYFGPVNIHRMSVKLVTSKGDTLDLNNADWSFSFECEQLYRA
jgi:hypothetical protein